MSDFLRALMHVRGQIELPIGLALAACVTIHVLLHKRQVTSSVGWIGLAWFAPFFGTASYFVFGVNRVRRRARRLRPPDKPSGSRSSRRSSSGGGYLDPLRLCIGRITDRPLMAGTRVCAYQNGDEAYPPMLQAIAGAKRSIGLSSYIFEDDQWGSRFIDALTEANSRDVAVRVLIDGIGGGWLRSRAYHKLRRNGVTAERFMHSLLPWRMPFINLRSHKKILVVDGVIGFTGGMNIADENVMATGEKHPVQDVHFRIEGPVVAQLTEAFADDWEFASDEELTSDVWWPDIPADGGVEARVIDSGPDEDLEKIEFAMLQAVNCAQTSIAIMTPYFLPDERLITALALAAMRGVAVDVVMPGKSDHALVDRAARANVTPLLPDGVRIWLSPEPFHHTKIMAVDKAWCLIGSSNWDIRSFRLNFELCMEVYDRDLAVTLTALIARAQGSELTKADLDARSVFGRMRDAGVRLLLPYL